MLQETATTLPWSIDDPTFRIIAQLAFCKLKTKEQQILLNVSTEQQPLLNNDTVDLEFMLQLSAFLDGSDVVYPPPRRSWLRLPIKTQKKKPSEVLTTFLSSYVDLSLKELNEQIQAFLPKDSIVADIKPPNIPIHPLKKWMATISAFFNRLHYSKFVIFSGALAFLELIGGIGAVIELSQYLCEIIGLTFSAPAALIVGLFFGLVYCSIIAVFDVKAVAEYMGVSYLNFRGELSNLIRQANILKQLNLDIKASLSALKDKNKSTVEKIDLLLIEQQHLHQLILKAEQNQIYVCNRIRHVETDFNKTKTKRRVLKLLWFILAAPLYAGAVNMTAVYILSTVVPLLGFPPLAAAIGISFALIWILIELYRFYQFEFQDMKTAVDKGYGADENSGETEECKVSITKGIQDNLHESLQLRESLLEKRTDLIEKTKLQQEVTFYRLPRVSDKKLQSTANKWGLFTPMTPQRQKTRKERCIERLNLFTNSPVLGYK